MAKTFRNVLIICMIIFSCCEVINAAEDEQDSPSVTPETESAPDKVTLNADRVSFNDETGHALAEGRAVLQYNDTSIMAERIEYDADTQKIQAMPLPGEKVVLKQENRILRGDQLNYDLNTKEGLLTGAATKVGIGDSGGVLFVHGEDIEVIPWALAQERGLVRGTPEDYFVRWHNVKITTCNLDHPHYRLEAKVITFVPGKRIIAKRPRVYLGNTYLFTSPLDYVLRLERREIGYAFLPYFQRSDTKGSGGGMSSMLGWETGSIALGVSWARKSGWEYRVEIEQELSDKFSIKVGAERTWNDLWQERLWHPYGSLIYHYNGWQAELKWSHNEYVEENKDAFTQYKGRVDREPEFYIYAPWFRSSTHTWSRIYAAYGSYKELIYGYPKSSTVSRFGLGLKSYFEYPIGETTLFSNLNAEAWRYDKDSMHMEMLRIFTGIKYNLGALELGTGYERQFSWGESAMYWDQYYDLERIHQKVRFPVGREIYLAVRGSYDLKASMIDKMIYSIQWVTDCMLWDLHYKNERTFGGNDSLGLTISINAYPDSDVSFGQKREVDPFVRPREIPKNK